MAACGGLGAVARVVVDALVTSRARSPFPWGILLVNLSGSFALGVLVGGAVTGDALFLVGTGFLGGYTTFSTWMLQTEGLGAEGRYALMLGNWAGSMALGLGAAGVGWTLGVLLA
jgi:CrcB protein